MKKELKKILYVEDEADIREIVKISLVTIGGFTVKLCSSGLEAIAKAETFKPDLYLLDVMMPVLDGIATLERLRKLPTVNHVPVIFMTARVQEGELQEYKQLNIMGIITKPFDPITLPDTIRQYWTDYNQ